MWHTLNFICNSQMPSNQREEHKFYEHFLKISKTKDEPFFSRQFESEVKARSGGSHRLKNNKSPGCDNIPAEFIKYCEEILLEDLTTIYNYIIELRDFLDIWAEGLRSVIFKAGQRNLVKNYRGITVSGLQKQLNGLFRFL